MKFGTPINKFGNPKASHSRPPSGSRGSSAFTLVEVLAAMLFMVIVIPIVVEALQVASLSGEVAARKSAASLIADHVLNESIVMTNWSSGSLNGTITQAGEEYNWRISNQTWNQDPTMNVVTVEVDYTAGGHAYAVKMNTLASLAMTGSTMGATP